MKILFLSTSDKNGGAAIASYRLFHSLKNKGIDAVMLVGEKTTHEEFILTAFKSRSGSIRRRRRLEEKFTKFHAIPRSLFSPAVIPEKLAKRIRSINPDIIHLHWVCGGFLRLETIGTLSDIPIVWTLHDMWPFTGGCHYDGGCGGYKKNCGKCPVLDSGKEKDLSRKVIERKKRSWSKSNIFVISPSRWLAQCARESILFKNRPVFTIHNGLDPDLYKAIDKELARKILLGDDFSRYKSLILFGALGAKSDTRKGFHLLRESLKIFRSAHGRNDTVLLIAGTKENKREIIEGMETISLGTLTDDIAMNIVYSAADVFLAPSIQDNFPNTALESLASGTPVVAFNTGGFPDMIIHRKNGYLAKPYDTSDFASGIKWCIEDADRKRALSSEARKHFLTNFTAEIIANKYLSIYEEIHNVGPK